MEDKVLEALGCLENIGFAPLNECCGSPYTRIYDEYEEDYNIIKQVLTSKSKKEQAFNIINEKGVDVGEFKKDFVYDNYEYEFYLDYYKHFSVEKLTREEYVLLKEVLQNA